MNWTPRKGTRAAAYLPLDVEEKGEECFFRQVYCMKWNNIPPKVLSLVVFSALLLLTWTCTISSTSISIRLVTTYCPAITARSMSAAPSRLTLWQRTRNTLTHSLLLAQRMVISCRFSRFGLEPQSDLYHQDMPIECKMHLSEDLILLLRRARRK